MPIIVRKATSNDLRFVRESWLDSYRTAHAAGMIQVADWGDVMRPQIDKVLARDGGEVIVLADTAGEGTRADVFGWLAHETGHRRPLVHYVYVKDKYRRSGLARALFAAAGIDPDAEFLHTCKTGVLSRLRSKIPHARWSPLLARFEQKKQTPEKHGD